MPAEFGPGNTLTITLAHETVTEVFTGFGEKRSLGSLALCNAFQEDLRSYKLPFPPAKPAA
ncbi:MAG: hypothetical protein WDM77_18380 [Steroidobacteraceae bacterium]